MAAAGSRGWIIVVLIVVGALGFMAIRQRPAAVPLALEVATPAPSPTVAATATAAPIVVFVSGAVNAPGVYRLPADARVVDALEAAGGPTEEAAVERLNQATRLSDGLQIHMPAVGEAAAPGPLPVAAPAFAASAGLVSLNHADAAALEQLPGIGPALAARIIAHREANGPFTSVQQLADVKGIGEKLLEQIQDYVVLD